MPGLSVANIEKRLNIKKNKNKNLTPLQRANKLKKLVKEVVANLPPPPPTRSGVSSTGRTYANMRS
jgi:hypothetical protein